MNALNAYNRLNANVAGMKKASEKLSSGYRINRAGDDAAGLAISEKMRSQIKGLNQAIRNSQDGINMIQTFEGAAQETHSILQRMKELATESANGTYDNATDRAAIQLEFDQLNDELNQIADTDFNGTIVLNGGEMSDGLRAVDGAFDYANKDASIAAKLKELNAEKDALEAYTPIDISKSDKYNTVDENKYDLDAAKELWDKDHLNLSADNDKYVDVTFTAKVADDGKITYEATSGASSTGTALTEDQLAFFATTAVNATGDATGKGGFKLDDIADVNVIFDASKIKTCDVITLRFDGPGVSPKAPANAGVADDSLKYSVDTAKGTVPTVTSKVEDDDMTADLVKVFDALNGAEFTATGTAGETAPDALNKLALKDKGGTAVTISAAGDFVLDGVKLNAALANGKLTIALGTAAAKGDDIIEIDMSTLFGANVANNDTASFKLAFDSYVAPAGTGVDVSPQATTVGDPDIAKKIADVQAKIDAIEKNQGASKSDSFNNASSIMTYTDNITLQTGSRTKDSVNFTFKYNTDGSADMGNLTANLNLSARADGLNTENLSLSNADNANYAIDQIDKAINKTSMVRATFGSIQNRLEHKITNLTTTSENLTEAECSIRDTDMASEMMNYTKYNILQQAAQSMLAQANQQPQSILQLLG